MILLTLHLPYDLYRHSCFLHAMNPGMTSWWFFTTHLKKTCASNWIISQGFGVNITNLENHPPGDQMEVNSSIDKLQNSRHSSIGLPGKPFPWDVSHGTYFMEIVKPLESIYSSITTFSSITGSGHPFFSQTYVCHSLNSLYWGWSSHL